VSAHPCMHVWFLKRVVVAMHAPVAGLFLTPHAWRTCHLCMHLCVFLSQSFQGKEALDFILISHPGNVDALDARGDFYLHNREMEARADAAVIVSLLNGEQLTARQLVVRARAHCWLHQYQRAHDDLDLCLVQVEGDDEVVFTEAYVGRVKLRLAEGWSPARACAEQVR